MSDKKLENPSENLMYKTKFIASELEPVQDIYVGRALKKAVSTDFNDLQVIASAELKILDGHHAWAGSILSNVVNIGGLKLDIKFDYARKILLKLSKKYGRVPEKESSGDILLSDFNTYKDLDYILNEVIPEYRSQVNDLIDRISLKVFIKRLDSIRDRVPVVGYLKERMPLFIRRKGDFERLIEEFRKAKIKTDSKSYDELMKDSGSSGGW